MLQHSPAHDGTMSNSSWLCDDPIDLRVKDRFGVDQLVDRLVFLLARANAPFTVSLSGAWGVGKSTIADAILVRLRECQVRAVKIDAWTQDVTQLRRSVVIEVGGALKRGKGDSRRQIAQELDDALATRTEVQSARLELRGWRELKSQYRHWPAYFLAAAAILLAVFGAASFGGDSVFRPISVNLASTLTVVLLASVVFRLVTPSTSRAPASEEFALAAKFAEIVTKHPGLCGYKGPVVVVIDNLDRLSGADALTALGQIRAIVEIEGSRCLFFIPIDRARLAEHLGRQLDPRAAVDYLEKFFGLDIQLAQPETVDLHAWAFQEAHALFGGGENEADLRSVAEIAVSVAGRSPRRVTRVLNGTFTRHRVLGRTEKIGLQQLAFMEGLVTIAPELVDYLAAEPRAFVEVRNQLGRQDDAASQQRVLDEFLIGHGGCGVAPHPKDKGGEQHDASARTQLRVFLVANQDIVVTREQARLALTLRQDRFWSGVTEADLLQVALDTGDGSAFAAQLGGLTDQERELALERSVQYVVRSSDFRRVVARALDAIAVQAQSMPQSLNERLHRTAVKALSDADSPLLQSLTLASIEFLFGQRPDEIGQTRLRSSLVVAINETTADLPITSLVRGARLVASMLPPDELNLVRERLATAGPDAQSPIFVAPPCLALAEGPVIETMLKNLGEWTSGAAGQEHVVLEAERLFDLSEAGWDEQASLTVLAGQITSEISVIGENPEVIASLDALMRLLALAQPGGEIDQLGLGLAAKRMAGDDQELFRYALMLKLQAPALTTVGAEIQAWLQSATPAQIRSLLVVARTRVAEALPPYVQSLLDRWASTADIEFAALALGDDLDGLKYLNTTWEGLPTATAMTQAVAALDLTETLGDRLEVVALVNLIAGRIARIPFPELTALPEVIDWLVKHKRSRQPLVDAFGVKVRKATSVAELLSVAPSVVRTAKSLGERQRARLAEALADGFVARNCGEPEHVSWLVEHLIAQDTRERLLVQLVERGLPLDPTLDAVSGVGNRFESIQIFEALVQRASGEPDEENARALFEAAADWPPSILPADSEAWAYLDALTSRHPSLSSQVEKLAPPDTEEGRGS